MVNVMLRMVSAMITMAYALGLSCIWHVYKAESGTLYLMCYVAVRTVLDVSSSIGFARREMFGTI